ncbi:hypothetical protein M3649_12210 [Ureibacillus chungkukjangi]|uniref:hypothetical protein n=1 Tax=Ureibacillus chungkukjangi TaxID=1202712 RepID=UPI0020400F8B|nr:hypothetical protein [Ureibacillus chungkukjangi]MCM3388898.1 hypothetical protein [Ureibacillus chungkukjangi]
MKFSFLIYIPIEIFMLSGCADNKNEPKKVTVESTTSYQALLNVNGDEYLGGNSVEMETYQIEKQIGEVKMKLSPELYPYKSFESNYLEEGTKLYSVKSYPYHLLAEVKPGVYELFSKSK